MDPLAPKDHAEEVALFRAQVIGEIARSALLHGELRARLESLTAKYFRPPGAEVTRTFSIPTLERWYYAYRAGGLPALRPKLRSDRGRAQDLTDEQRALLADIRRENPQASAALIRRTLITDGRLAKDALSESTLRRFFVEQGLDRIPLRDGDGQRMRLRWQAERPGALWHGDVCHGPALRIGDVAKPLRVHALLDDASRFVVAIEAHHTERESDMLGLTVRALRRHGAPDALYLDNGSTYRGQVLALGCERLGITLLHARPGDAPARGKMERFWRTLRQGCLDFLGQLASLHEVNVRLCAFLDQHYHRAPHGGLLGKSPGDIFHADPGRPADALTEQQIRDALSVRERRRVRRDNTLSLDGVVWELDQGFLAGRVVTVARCLVDGADPPVVEHEGKSLPLHRADPVRNARRKRPARRAATKKRAVPFDPPGALLDRAAGRKPRHKEDAT